MAVDQRGYKVTPQAPRPQKGKPSMRIPGDGDVESAPGTVDNRSARHDAEGTQKMVGGGRAKKPQYHK